MSGELQKRCGFVGLVGRPNVGKSTIVNYFLGEKISIVSSIPQTTRYAIKGILTRDNYQIIFLDTPGMHSYKDRLAQHLNKIASSSVFSCDLLLYVVDINRKPGLEERRLMENILKNRIKTIMALNKIDQGKHYLNDYIQDWRQVSREDERLILYYIPTSAKTGKNMDKLLESILENLPQSKEYFYPPGIMTDFPLKFRLADIIREKLFLKLKEELPHSLAVEVEEIEDKRNIFSVSAIIYLNRPSQKQIVVGEKGNIIKEVGIQSRQDMEKILKRKVYLKLWVKVLKNWQSSPRLLKELGYDVF